MVKIRLKPDRAEIANIEDEPGPNGDDFIVGVLGVPDCISFYEVGHKLFLSGIREKLVRWQKIEHLRETLDFYNFDDDEKEIF